MKILYIIINRVSAYGVMGILGLFAGMIWLFSAVRKEKKQSAFNEIEYDDVIYIYIWSVISALIGAKLLYLFVDKRNIYLSIKTMGINYNVIKQYLSGGFVFYGGLFGSILGFYASCRFFSIEVSNVLRYFVPCIPLVHAFGRLGCLIVGCCYGKQTNQLFSIKYTHSVYAPNNTPLVPTQLMEALFEFTLFAVLMLFFLLKRYEINGLVFYLYLYAFFRFIIEFYRGDEARGGYIGMSTSQWISIAIIIILIVYNIIRKCSLSKLS